MTALKIQSNTPVFEITESFISKIKEKSLVKRSVKGVYESIKGDPEYANVNEDTLKKSIEAILINLKKDSEETHDQNAKRIGLLNENLSDVLIYSDERGDTAIFKVSADKVCSRVAESFVLERISKLVFKYEGKILSHVQLKDLYKNWLLYCDNKTQELPIPFATKSQDSFCFKKFEFDFDFARESNDDYNCPTFKTWLKNCDNPEVLSAYVGSVFMPDSVLRQYLFLYGPGGDGKSSLCRLLEAIWGKTGYTALTPTQDHMASALLGKRIGAFLDVNNVRFMMSAIFKNITGGDAVVVSEKYEKAFSATLNSKLIVTANFLPQFTSEKSNLDRCLLIKFKGQDEGQIYIENLEVKLKQELQEIVNYCIFMYHKNSDSLGLINFDRSVLADIGEDFDAVPEAIFAEKFEVVEGHRINKTDFIAAINPTLQKNKLTWNDFKTYLDRSGIKASRDSKGPRYYKNIKLKDSIPF